MNNKNKTVITGPEAVKKLKDELNTLERETTLEKKASLEKRIEKLEIEIQLIKDIISNSINLKQKKVMKD